MIDSPPPPDAPSAAPQPQADSTSEPLTTPESARLPIVGIGASAGGLEALEALVGRLSSDGMAYVVQQHLAAGQESLLTDILARATSLVVITISDQLAAQANVIYVVPPGAEVTIHQGLFQVSQATERIPRQSINRLFSSLASELGAAAIGVVLSGAGSDGTLGLRAIKEGGGITFAQDPSTAI